MLNRLRKSLKRLLRAQDGECELSRALSTDVGAQTSADLAYYREHAARQAAILQDMTAERRLHERIKPAELDMLKPVFQDPINDPRGD